jgi:signal transduction histidine kinase
VSKIAIFLTTEGDDMRPKLEAGLRASGFLVDRVLTYDEAPELFEGEVIFTSPRHDEPPAAPQAAAVSVKTLLIEMLMHQLANIVKDQESVTSTLVDMLKTGAWLTDQQFKKQIIAMHDVSRQHVNILDLMSDVVADNSTGPCQLREAVDRTCKLLSSALLHRQIEIDNRVAPNISLGVPIQALVMVLCNLVGNAKEAIGDARQRGRSAGKIMIVTECEDPEHVLCRVIDDGVGVPEDMRERIFEEGVTTKQTKGGRRGGQGLPLSVRVLVGSGANIELTGSKPGETVFTIRFPKSAKEAE